MLPKYKAAFVTKKSPVCQQNDFMKEDQSFGTPYLKLYKVIGLDKCCEKDHDF